ncbi:MAG: sensor histidine kinase [Ktedonobacterales bacterium]
MACARRRAALISNALKYSDVTQTTLVEVFGEVPLSLRENAIMVGDLDLDATPHVCVAVTDEGVGISPETLPRIFDRFYRVPESAERSGSHIGMGLGLYLSKHIVDLHGGVLGVTSAVRTGSRFWFALPVGPC